VAGGLGALFFGEWETTIRTLARAPRDFAEAKKTALLQEAQMFRTKIIEGMREQAPAGQAFRPLAPSTIAMRKFLGFKGSKALMRRGDLRNSIVVHEIGEDVFVGIMRNAKSRTGEPMIDIAKLNEYGSKPIVIKITPKMAALLHMAFRKAGGSMNRMGPPRASTGLIVVQIPARPFLAPVFEKYGASDEAQRRYAERVAKFMKGKGPWQAAKDLV
jgi:hypothetical protein